MGRVIVKESPLNAGRKVFIRTAVYDYVGYVLRVSRYEVLLGDCSWVADAGVRLGELLRTGKWSSQSETEYVPGVVSVKQSVIADTFEWNHELPKESQ